MASNRTPEASRSGFRWAAAAGVVLALAACTSGGGKAEATSTPASPSGVPHSLQRFYTQKVVWSGCGGGFQCANVTVPVDYTKPEGGTLQLAVVRKPATDQKHRIGSLLVNPGGPGGSGVDYARGVGVVTSAVQAKFDLVGFDPRGVGRSDPVKCLDDNEMDKFVAVDPTPDTPADQAAVISESQDFARKCGERAAELLPHVGTPDAARDLDVLRGALGDSKVYYLGKSYGTYLGAVYAELFPNRVGRLVLDGAIDPSLTGKQMDLAQAVGFENAVKLFVADCMTHNDCPLGSGSGSDAVAAGTAKLESFLHGLDTNPLPGDSSRKLGEGLATTGVIVAMYDQGSWPILRQALTKAFAGDGSALLQLADFYNDRENGHYKDNQDQANLAVNCLDHPDVTSVGDVQAELPQFEQTSPMFGEMVAWSSLPCAYWPVKPETQPHRITAPGAAPILVVGTTRDPATPYAWAQGLAAQLSSGHLLTFNGDGHTAYTRGSGCIDGAVDAYLLSGKLPPAGTVCQPDGS